MYGLAIVLLSFLYFERSNGLYDDRAVLASCSYSYWEIINGNIVSVG